jgi:acetyl-CoA carboxylase/biotin carboxylase 1
MKRNDVAQTIRFVISSSTGFTTRVDVYRETRDGAGVNRLESLTEPHGELHKQMVHQTYPIRESVQPRRYKAHLMGTTYVYDFPELFKRSLEKRWKDWGGVKGDVLEYSEYVMDGNGLRAVEREKGLNDCGMVVWVMKMKTPENPNGRRVLIVANDITYKIGSFGTVEDDVFNCATEYSREHGIPRIYISANSGARIGLCEETREKFRIMFVDEAKPEKGVDYLYLEEVDWKEMGDRELECIQCEKVLVEGRNIYRIKAIIGKEHGIGVENLKGSGLIAGGTSRAYKDIFTLTLVTCRSVGKLSIL